MPARCVSVSCSNVVDPKKNIPIYVEDSILWRGTPDKEEKKKEVDQFCVGEVKDAGAREDFLSTGTTIQIMFVSSLHIYKCRPYFGIYMHMLFLSFLSVELIPRVRVCAISF